MTSKTSGLTFRQTTAAYKRLQRKLIVEALELAQMRLYHFDRFGEDPEHVDLDDDDEEEGKS